MDENFKDMSLADINDIFDTHVTNLKKSIELERVETTRQSMLARAGYHSERKFYDRMNTAMLVFVLIIVMWVFATITYFLNEEDPVIVEYVEPDEIWSSCEHREFSFERRVVSTKDIKVEVFERYYDLDGLNDFGDGGREFQNNITTTYPISKGSHIYKFNKVLPTLVGVGLYEYRPYIYYMVNPLKPITKPLPVQFVFVSCNKYDEPK